MISSQKHTSDTTELVETKHHKFHVKGPKRTVANKKK